MVPLRRSASFRISVDKVEVEPVIRYTNHLLTQQEEGEEEVETARLQNGGHLHKNGGHHLHAQENGGQETDEVEEVDEEPPVNIISGPDWESVNYTVAKVQCEGEVTGLAVSGDYLVAQYYTEAEIDVFSRSSLQPLHRLVGHEYGGQALLILNHILYSGSKDCTVRTWDLRTGQCLATVKDHKDYVQCLAGKKIHMAGLGEDGEGTAVASGGAADHRAVLYSTDSSGQLKRRFYLEGHLGWITSLEITDTLVISGSKDCTVRLWDLASGDLLQSILQDGEISCLSLFSLAQGYLIFGDSESKLSLVDLATGQTVHLMPNTLVGTGRYRRSSKYHDKSVDSFHLCSNGYMVTASSGSKFIKIWKVEGYEADILRTEVTELQILREHADYLTIFRLQDSSIFSSSGDGTIFIHTFPEGQQHYDMLRTHERNSVAVLFQGGVQELAPTLEKSAVVCEGRLCRVGKIGLAKSSSSFQVCFALKPATASAEGRLCLPQTIDEESDEDEFVIEYVTDSEADENEDEDEEW